MLANPFIFFILEYFTLFFDIFHPANVFEGLLFVLFAGATAVQLFIWSLLYGRMAKRYQYPVAFEKALPLPAVSVIICARNEADNLQKKLPEILEQQYPADFEVIVADDASEDATNAILQAFQKKYVHLKVLRIAQKRSPGKKEALEQGVLAARYDWLLLTDADCSPASPFWIREMLQHRTTPDTKIIAGYAPLRPPQKASGFSLLRFFAPYEGAFTALQYGAFVRWGIPYMGVGRNLAWNKSLFEKNKGFSAHQHLASGDDDLFVNAVATRDNMQLCLQPATFMYSTAPATWGEWLRQKRRHLSTGKQYRMLHRILLGGAALTHTLHYGLGCILLIWGHFFAPVAVLYLLRLLIVWPVCGRIFATLREHRLIPLLPLWDGLLAVWYGAFVPFLMWGRGRIRWKERGGEV